jgi:hypothetical protein
MQNSFPWICVINTRDLVFNLMYLIVYTMMT